MARASARSSKARPVPAARGVPQGARRGAAGDAPAVDLRLYHRASRGVALSLVFLAPLLAAYEWVLRSQDARTREVVEGGIRDLLWYLGPGAAYVHLFLAAAIGIALWTVLRERASLLAFFPLFLVESLLFALLLGPAIALTAGVVPLATRLPETVDQAIPSLLSSIGAGIYEELLFRLALMGGLYQLLVKVYRARRERAFLIALLVSAFAFAGYHHVGPFAEAFELRAFAFRAAAGILLGLVFALRGLGVVIYLHAFYDVIHDLARFTSAS